MALIPFAATKRFENNPAGWGGPNAAVGPNAYSASLLCPWTAWRSENRRRIAWRIAWRTGSTCLPRITHRTAPRFLQLQRSLAALAALQRFRMNITDIQRRDTARTSRMSAHAHRHGPAAVHRRGLRAAAA